MSARSYVPILTALALIGCRTTPEPVKPPPPVDPKPVVKVVTPPPVIATGPGLTFQVEPEDAVVDIDGTPSGRIVDLAGAYLKLTPGIYQVSLKHDGFITWRAEVTVGESAPERLQVKMVPRP